MKNHLNLIEKILALLFFISLFLPYVGDISPMSTLYKDFNGISIFFLLAIVPFLGYLSIIFFFQSQEKEVNKVAYVLSLIFVYLIFLLLFGFMLLTVADGVSTYWIFCYLSIFVIASPIVFFTVFSKLSTSLKIGNLLIAGILPSAALFAIIFSPFSFGKPSYGYYVSNICFALIVTIRAYYIFSSRIQQNKS